MYFDEDDLWLGILAVSAFAILPTTNSLKGYSPYKLVLGCDMII